MILAGERYIYKIKDLRKKLKNLSRDGRGWKNLGEENQNEGTRGNEDAYLDSSK